MNAEHISLLVSLSWKRYKEKKGIVKRKLANKSREVSKRENPQTWSRCTGLSQLLP
jgi:hypothetical protein